MVKKIKVLPGLEPGLQGSEPWVLTNYTIEPDTRDSGTEKQTKKSSRRETRTLNLPVNSRARCRLRHPGSDGNWSPLRAVVHSWPSG